MDKPTVQQVKEYADSIGFEIDAEYFIAKNNTIGWMVGSKRNAKPMVSWKSAVQTWHLAAKRRQKAVQGEITGRVRQQPRFYEPTVFVQCVKGPSVGRYLPVQFGGPQGEKPDEQYLLAAKGVIKLLERLYGKNEWVIRENTTSAQLQRERSAAIRAKIDAAPKIKRRTPSQIKYEIRRQIKEARTKELEDDLKF